MKRLLILLFVIPLLLIGCRAHFPVAQESGKEDIAYMQEKVFLLKLITTLHLKRKL